MKGTQGSHITPRNTPLKKSPHLLEGNPGKKSSHIKAGMTKWWAKPQSTVWVRMSARPYDLWSMISISRLTFSTTVLRAHGADSTARVGGKELHAKEGQWVQRTGGQVGPGHTELWEAALGKASQFLPRVRGQESKVLVLATSSVTLNCS